MSVGIADAARYLRGQFAAHRNAPRINLLWRGCEHLGDGLVRELEMKHAIVRRLAEEGKRGQSRDPNHAMCRVCASYM